MIDNIDSLSSKFDSLEHYCEFLERKLHGAEIRIRELEFQIKNPIELPKTPEQLICESEIEKLKQTSNSRSLTLEETKRFDILVKNLLLSKEAQKNEKASAPGDSITISQLDLIKIASLPDGNLSIN